MAGNTKFGFEIETDEDRKKIQDQLKKITLPENDDGAVNIQGGGYYGYYLDMDYQAKNEIDLITKYREMAASPEIDEALEDIVNDSLVFDEKGNCVKINLDDLENVSDGIKKKIINEFENVLRLLEFSDKGYDIYRNWYVDGRSYYHIVLNEENVKDGIQELEYIDPIRIKKVRVIQKKPDPQTGVEIVHNVDEHFIYNERGIMNAETNVGVKIAKDSIAYITSGLLDAKKNYVVSYLNKAIKPFNQLRMVENALVIYRLARAPERRLFYIDVGTMSTRKAEAYVRGLRNNFRNKLVYDASTGEIRDDRKFMSMLEDFWLPRREGGRGTEVETLPGGQNLGDIEDIIYFQKRLYRALNVPTSRLEEQQGFTLGRSTEITRDELKFARFIGKLRKKFSGLFDQLMRVQLTAKNICTPEDWDEWRYFIWYDFLKDNNFDELKENELKRERIDLLGQMQDYVGLYFSRGYIMREVLKMTEEEIKEMDKEILEEQNDKNNPLTKMKQAEMEQQMGGDYGGDDGPQENFPERDPPPANNRPVRKSENPDEPEVER